MNNNQHNKLLSSIELNNNNNSNSKYNIYNKNNKNYKNNKNKNYKINKSKNKNKSKKNIPKKIREQIWINNIGKEFDSKCMIDWCTNKIDVFNFHVGHNIPESKGGTLELSNLKPLCANCNLSMSNNYTIDEWNNINNTSRSFFKNIINKCLYSSILLIPIIYYYFFMINNKKR